MKQIKNILVASELNINSYEALAYGITLGLIHDATVSCIHVVKNSPLDFVKKSFNVGSKNYVDGLKLAKEKSETLLENIIDEITKELGVGEVEIDLNIVDGSLTKSIMDYAAKIDADLVVIGTDLGSRFSRTEHTNLALNMIISEKANVLLIPSDFKMERIEQYGAFINFEIEEISFINQMIKHAKHTQNCLKLIHVIKPKDNIVSKKQLKQSFEKLFSSEISKNLIQFEFASGKLPDIVNKLKTEHNIDLMFIRAYKSHWDIHSSSSSFSRNAIKNIKNPLLVLKNVKPKK